MGKYKRTSRVADLIKKEVAEILYRRVKDPRIQGVTITEVVMTEDLKEAKIFYCNTYKKVDKTAMGEALYRASGFIRRELSERLYLRYLPRLHFFYDDSFDYGERMDRIIDLLKEKSGEEEDD